jgi:hypothetical protein
MLLKHNIYLLLLFLTFFLLSATVTRAAEFDAIAFYRATEAKGSKQSQKYDRITIKNGNNRLVYDVERGATYVIKDRFVETIIVEKTRRFGSTPSELMELAREAYSQSSKSSLQDQSDSSYGYSYNLRFRIASQEVSRFMKFANANLDRTFKATIDNHIIGIIGFHVPFDRQTTKYFEFTAPVLDDDADRLKRMLSRLSGKVIWQQS